MFFGFVFEQVREAIELPSVEFLVPTLTPVTRLTILILTNPTQVTNSDATNLVVYALLYDVFGEGVQEVVFPTRQKIDQVAVSNRCMLTKPKDYLVDKLRYPYYRSLQYVGETLVDGDVIYEDDWDLMLILDSCRFDLMREAASEYDFIQKIESRKSVGGATLEWMDRTFTADYREEIADTHYICGNPFSETYLDDDMFAHLDEVWQDVWTNTVPSRAITDRTIEYARRVDYERLLVHYMQPHCPFLVWGEDAQDKRVEHFGSQKTRGVWEKMRDGELSREEVWPA